MKYNDVEVTFENYLTVFQGYPLDVVDEVRSSLMDNTPVGAFIDECRNNPYRLQQIRVGMKEYADTRMFALEFGDCIRRARALAKDGVNLERLYTLSSVPVEEDYYMVLLDWLEAGAYIPDDLDLFKIRKEFLSLLSWCVLHRVDTSQVFEIDWVDLDYALAVIPLRQKGIDISPMLSEKWNTECLMELKTVSHRKYLPALLDCLDHRSTAESVKALNALGDAKFDLSDPDIRGLPDYQLEWVVEAWKNGMDWSPFVGEVRSAGWLADTFSELVRKKKPVMLKRF